MLLTSDLRPCLPFLKLFQNLRTLMTPYKVTFESPLELSAQGELSQLPTERTAQVSLFRLLARPEPLALSLSCAGKQMIETYFDFRLYRLWKSRQHSKLLDFDDVL